MPTTQEEKPGKPRARNRKAESRRSKSGQPQVEVRAEPDPVSVMVTETEVVAVEVAPVDVAPVVAMEKAEETVLSGEVLPPEVHAPVPEAAGLQAITQAYGEYTKKSWINGRFLAERLIAVRSFDEAIEVQGEFAKQAYANFLAHSQKICVLYGEWAQQFFRPFEKLATDRPRIGR
jgi:hypothetical protein